MCGCNCPYGSFPACRVARGGKPCYLEDDAFAAENAFSAEDTFAVDDDPPGSRYVCPPVFG